MMKIIMKMINCIYIFLFIYVALNEEKMTLLARLKNIEKGSESKGGKSEREKATEELKSKLKAAETLCESLMDENEDMKKEIRELEEEIYEMQDNFRLFLYFYFSKKKKKNVLLIFIFITSTNHFK